MSSRHPPAQRMTMIATFDDPNRFKSCTSPLILEFVLDVHYSTIDKPKMDQAPTWHQLSPSRHEIRLLTVEPASATTDDLSCSLSIVSLDGDPTYLALSYTWGDPTVTVPIFLNGKPWQVTTNLSDALRGLRNTFQPLTFFVDALCINQHDLDEKNVQVPSMGRIYHQASIVHCWLNFPERNHIRAVETFKQAAKGVTIGEMSTYSKPVDLADMKSLTAFLSNPYWKRAWIIQEIILASEVVFHYGSQQFLRHEIPSFAAFVCLTCELI